MVLKDKRFYSGKRLVASFKYAFQGLIHVIKHEKNFQIHLIVAGVIIILSIFLELKKMEWLFIVLSIFGVFVLELVNSAIERAVDLVTNEIKPLAKQAKDIAAAAVLLYAMMSVIIGIVILGPKLLILFL